MKSYLAEDTEKTVLLDTLGYDELWVGEHFAALSKIRAPRKR
jgi:alkanesulfonate monooxygenase SsuD/methylene tetrahydromethanopterin reductase-like flavin-dependent oxidoreductase (luciferase family)